MIELVRAFQGGKMNKDLDERLVPNGEYRDALNIEVETSEGSGVGTIQNIPGNLETANSSYNNVTGLTTAWTSEYITSLTNPKVIGGIRYDQEEKLYWFISSLNVSAIAEYDQATDVVRPVLVDTNNILKFSEDYLITGVNIIEGILFFTDDQTEPKKVNIEDAKAGSVDFTTHTQLRGADFIEADITVIKKSPLTAPTLNMSASKFGNNIPGTGITPIPITYMVTGMPNFTYIPDTTNPEDYKSLETYAEWAELTTNGTNLAHYADSSIPGWNGKVTLTIATIASAWAVNDVIELKGSMVDDYDQTLEYQVNVSIESITGNTIVGKIQAISSNITRSFDDTGNVTPIVWESIVNEGDPLFRFLFPRFACRWKYKDGEYSCFSPFTTVAFIGSEFKYISSDGYNIGMTNNIRKLVIENIPFGSSEVIEVDVLYKESQSNAVYVVDTIKKADATSNTFEIKSEVIGALLESNQLLRHWDNVPRVAKAQEITGNRLIYGNYLQNYTVSEPVSLIVSESLTTHPGNISVGNETTQNTEVRRPYPSIKSIRTYQAGIAYADPYGRETPVITSKNASCKIDKASAKYVNKLAVKPTNNPPSFATHYKIFVKETSNEYYNLALDRFYFAEDGNIWLSFPSSERNKVDEESYLILKKQHDNDVPTEGIDRYKILAIENEAPEFISTFKRSVALSEVSLISQIGQDYSFLNFNGPSATDNPQFAGGFTSDNFVKIVKSGNSTGYYRIATGGRTGAGNSYNVTLSEPLGSDAGFLDDIAVGQTVRIEIYTDKRDRLPEFEGRFFVKINRDFAFDTNIISSFGEEDARYGIIGELGFKSWSVGDLVGESSRWGPNWQDRGEGGRRSRWNTESGPCGGDMGYWLPQVFRTNYSTPFQGSRWFGFNWSGIQSGESLSTYGFEIMGLTNNAMTNCKLIPGASIRFKNNYTEELSEVYVIEEAYGEHTYRGKTSFNLSGTVNVGDTGNKKMSWLFKLKKPILDTFMPASACEEFSPDKYSIQLLEKITSDGNKMLSSTNPAIFETEPKEAIDLNLYYQASNALDIATHGNTIVLDWFNCYSYGNGVESNRIRDDYNAYTIDKGPKVSTVLDEPYAQERRGSGLIFSQIFNSVAGVNRLNQFIQAEAITKDLNPVYGTIQKLHSRDSDLIALCEDKCLKILSNKDALYNADGNVNVTSNNNVLGQAMPYAGEYGISKNPESFASYGFRVYFSDKNRGAIIRLSMDGITPISEAGMNDFFADNLRLCKNIYGSYDEDKGNYNVTLPSLSSQWQAILSPNRNTIFSIDCGNTVIQPQTQTTVSFSEGVEGWTSRKSFIPEFGISLNNTYFTFKNGRIWEHGLNPLRNNFYGTQYDSSFNAILNDNPLSVKSFKTLNYTGTQSRKYKYLYNTKLYSLEEIVANQTIPTAMNQTKNGWYVNYITTDMESGIVKEFLNKENKWFNYIKPIDERKNCNPTNIISIGTPTDVVAENLLYTVTVGVNTTCSIP
jgi:hypothetical protein